MSHQEGKEAAESKSKCVDHGSGSSCFDGGDLADKDVRHHRAKPNAETVDAPANGKQPEGMTVEHDGEAEDAEHAGEEQHLFSAQPLASGESSNDAKHLEKGDQTEIPGRFLLVELDEGPVPCVVVFHVRLKCKPSVHITSSHCHPCHKEDGDRDHKVRRR